MALIHRTAIVHDDAKSHPSVTVGPYSIIDANVEIGEGCRVESNARIFAGTHMVFLPGFTRLASFFASNR